MTDLFWPGDERAGDLMSEASLLHAMVRVEAVWLEALVDAELAPAIDDAATTVPRLATDDDVEVVALGAESAGDPVIPLVQLLRSRADAEVATWLHLGLTSQDVLDTALVLVVRDVLTRVLEELKAQVAALSALAEQHARTLMVGRTLTQHAGPTTFGAVAAGWLDGIVDAADLVVDARSLLPVQVGGAVGTLAATAELARLRDHDDPASTAAELVTDVAEALELRERRPWHTSRGSLTRTADALVAVTDTWGHVATDVATLSRTEVGELVEPSGGGRGGSSTVPHQRNPVLSVLVRRAALAAPGLGSTMHLASAVSGDQRPDGAWHVEWATLRILGRRTVVAGSQTTELVQGLRVDADRMRATLDRSSHDMVAERRAMADLVGADLVGAEHETDPTTYLGITEDLVVEAVERAQTFLEENP